MPTRTLSRSNFDLASQSFLKKYDPISDPTYLAEGLRGWAWNEHTSIPGLGYMSRTVTLHQRSSCEQSDSLPEFAIQNTDHLESVYDDATLPQLNPDLRFVCHQYVVYSLSFQVPAFYFTIHDSNGSPLHLDAIVNTSLFRPFALEGTEKSSFGLGHPASTFPLLSQGDHPTLGTPSWYFHPCETAAAVGEVMEELKQTGCSEDELLRWLEAWFMILGTVVDLKN